MNPNVVGVLVEPIQGESGIIVPPAGYLKGIEALCREHRALFSATPAEMTSLLPWLRVLGLTPEPLPGGIPKL